MKAKFILLVALVAIGVVQANACTNFLVGRKASVDGSTMISYSADSYWLYGALYHYPAAKYPAGTKMDVYEWDTGKYLGQIDQASETYNVIGNMNEYQVTIGETTYGGREELVDTTGLIDYGSLIYITLQRSKNAREAIYNMVKLVEKYGYCSEGESFSIGDPKEIWILEMIGKGPGRKGAVWVARRLPDDCVSGHANQARITTFPLETKKDKTTISSKNLKRIHEPQITTIYSSDVIALAREKKYFSGKDEEFSFSDTYNPLDFSGVRICEARVWQFFNRCDPKLMEKYISYIECKTKERMPLWIKPNRQIGVWDVKDAMRDHYEGTPWDTSKGMGTGGFQSVYRATPLFYKSSEGTEYFHERPVATQQTGFTFVAQMRSFLPRQIGGILWFGVDDATCNIYLPIYCCTNHVPESLSEETANMFKFSWNSAFWVNNWIANMVYYRYSDLMPEVKDRQIAFEKKLYEETTEMDKKAQLILRDKPDQIVKILTEYSNSKADQALKEWRNLGEYLMVKYVDGVEKGMENGRFKMNNKAIPGEVIRKGYSQEYIESNLVKPNPERFRAKTKAEMDKRK
ncbi:MAG: C69 family dipeptidase [bacterium]|nr:C69 family dipeptidase [Candidatus Minthenecus merdequi]